MPDAIGPANPDPESVDALLAELLEGNFVTPDEDPASSTGSGPDAPNADQVDGAQTEVNGYEASIEAIIGSEDPTVAFPGGIPMVPVVTINDTALDGAETDDQDAVGNEVSDGSDASDLSPGADPVAVPDSGEDLELDSETEPDGAANVVTPPSGEDDEVISSTDGTAVIGELKPKPAIPSPVATADSSGSSFAKLAKLAVVAILGLLVLLLAAWGMDLARHQTAVMGGVSLDGESIAGLSANELRQVLDERQQELVTSPIVVDVGDTTVTTDPMTLGVSIDQDEVVAAAMNVGRDGLILTRPFAWLGRLVGGHDLTTLYQYDAETAAGAAMSVVAAELDQPKEPELVLDGNERLVVEPGNSGTTISPRELVGRLPAVIEAGPPYMIELQAEVADPVTDQAALEAVAADINKHTAEPVRMRVIDKFADIQPAMLKDWTIVDTSDGGASWTIDQERVLADLRPLFPDLGSEDQKARFSVVDDKPVIVPASETIVCCDEESVGTIRTSLTDPISPGDEEDEDSDDDGDEEAPARTITLEPTVVGFDEGVAELESLGIIEMVSTFTTKHACCQNRVKNIQRFADLMQGVIIRPGESFSLNGHVGRRTIEKGFVADGAISLGVIEPQVGGGISQYATTFFNASFFAGIEYLNYQSHSLYISRYPRGREATISWRRPDLEVRNNTPYGILVWNEYTSTSITVSFYSTKHLEVEALPLRRASERKCRVDITPRVITYADGSTAEDSVRALYRPGEGLDCNGDSTRPEEDEAVPVSTTTTTAVLPDPDPDPDPQPDPDPTTPTTAVPTTEEPDA